MSLSRDDILMTGYWCTTWRWFQLLMVECSARTGRKTGGGRRRFVLCVRVWIALSVVVYRIPVSMLVLVVA